MSATMCDPADHVFGWSSDSHYYCDCGFQMGPLADLDTQEAYGLLSELVDGGFLHCVHRSDGYQATLIAPNCDECLPCRARMYLEAVGDVRVKVARGVCPMLCDDDCDSICHEEHVIERKRTHDPMNCPARAARSVGGSPTPEEKEQG